MNDNDKDKKHEFPNAYTVMLANGAIIGVPGESQEEVYQLINSLSSASMGLTKLIPLPTVNFKTGEISTTYLDYTIVEMISQEVNWEHEQKPREDPALLNALKSSGIPVKGLVPANEP